MDYLRGSSKVLPREIHGVASLFVGLELEVICGQPKVS